MKGGKGTFKLDFSQMILFRTSSSFFSISPGVLSNSSAIFLCKSRGSVGNCSHRSPSITSCQLII